MEVNTNANKQACPLACLLVCCYLGIVIAISNAMAMMIAPRSWNVI
jgi:hypothetical protein